MKITDDYKAKYRLWAANPQVIPASPPTHIPNFKSRKFSSYHEFNEWKRSVVCELARVTTEQSQNSAQ